MDIDVIATQIHGAIPKDARADLLDSFFHYTTNEYTGSGSIAGFSIDRGHMTRSFDRTAGILDNATTFYLSNVVPQASELNQGPGVVEAAVWSP